MKTTRTTFFTRDKKFYKTFFRLMLVVALQNLVAYSVNMLDNIMLGSYSQNALSGAATLLPGSRGRAVLSLLAEAVSTGMKL